MLKIVNLLNAGSKNMNVNGSVTPAVFSASPGSGTVKIIGLVCILEDAGTSALGSFGAIAALTNGITIEAVKDGETLDIVTIKDNADMITRFYKNHFGSAASDALGNPVGFGQSHDAFVGLMDFNASVYLTDADEIRATVNDNLSGIGVLQMALITIGSS